MIKTSKFDAANYLKSPQAMADYPSEALATDDPEFICDGGNGLFLRAPSGAAIFDPGAFRF